MISISIKIGMGPDEDPLILQARYLLEKCRDFLEHPRATKNERQAMAVCIPQLETLLFSYAHADDGEESDEILKELEYIVPKVRALIRGIQTRKA